MPGKIMYASAMQCQPVHTKWHRFSFAVIVVPHFQKVLEVICEVLQVAYRMQNHAISCDGRYNTKITLCQMYREKSQTEMYIGHECP